MSENITQLERRVDVAQGEADLRLVLDELAFRSTRAARRLEARVRILLGGAPEGSTSQRPEQSQPLPGVESWPTRGQPPPPHRPERDEYPPTPEQESAIAAFLTGGSLKIAAFAGAGKTSTLKMMARRHAGRGLSTDADDDVKLADEETRLFYVAITRAKRALSVDPATLAAFSAYARF